MGAQGLMQIMPATAKLIARQHKIPYRNGMLTSDPAMNVKMGAAHLGDLIDNFNGSYVLTLVPTMQARAGRASGPNSSVTCAPARWTRWIGLRTFHSRNPPICPEGHAEPARLSLTSRTKDRAPNDR